MARILVVDDEAAVLEIMRRSLERAGHTVTTATNGAEALRLYRADPPDLVVTDLYMPETAGVTMIRELRSDYPDGLILAVSGGGQSMTGDVLADAEAYGADASLGKPFTPKQLQETVEALLLKRGA